MKSLFSFQGRIGRKTFWMTTLALVGVSIVVQFGMIMALGGFEAMTDPQAGADLNPIVMVPFVVFIVAITWCGLALHVKRWHDRDKSGWMVLVNLIPVIGPFWGIIVAGFLKGTEGDNRFGPDPV